MNDWLQKPIGTTAFAFRGYNITNLGKTPELLAHPAYGAIVEKWLKKAGAICSQIGGKRVNLVQRVRRRRNTTLKTYAEAISMILATEMAQLELLEQFFGINYRESQCALGYSLGEVAAVTAGGVFELESVLTPLITMAGDVAALAENVRLGILFSRGPALDVEKVERHCVKITSEGKGCIAISAMLSPNTVLLLGQGRTIQHFKNTMHEFLSKAFHLRENPHHWPPMHTPIVRHANVPNRAYTIMETLPGGFVEPSPPILSCVTGQSSYTDYHSRELLMRWVDHPQRLWDAVDKLLAEGVETVVHVGPEPNIIPATFKRLTMNISTQLGGRSLSSLGLRAVSRIVRRRRPWLTNLLSSDATLLRAPFVDQIVLEDWLLKQDDRVRG